MPPESQSSEWQPENWQVDLESRIKMVMPTASPVERERILYEAAYQRGRRSMRVPSFLTSVGSCAATLLIAWCGMTFTQVTTIDKPLIAEAKTRVIADVAITTKPPVLSSNQSAESRIQLQQPLSVVSLRGAKSRMPIEDWLRELDRFQESPTDIAPDAEPMLRPRSSIDFL